MSARAKPKHTRRNSSSCARMRPIRSALRRKRPPNKCTASAPVTRRGLNSTIDSTRKPLESPFWFPPSSMTSPSPTSSAPRAKNPPCMKSRMADRTCFRSSLRMACTSHQKSSTQATLRSARKNSCLRGTRPRTEGSAMSQSVEVQERAPKPPGLLPKNVQSWLLVGLAFLMVAIMWLTGSKKPAPPAKLGAPASPLGAPLEVNETKINELQNRIEQLQREQLVAQSALAQQTRLLAAAPQDAQPPGQQNAAASGPDQRADDPIQAERKRRAYVSLFASNVALTYRKTPPSVPAPESDAAPVAQSFVPVGPDSAAVAQLLKDMPGKPAPAPLRNDSAELDRDQKEGAKNPGAATAGSDNAAAGKTYLLFEGTVLESVLINRLDGGFTGPVECLLSNDVYSNDRQHLLIPAGSKLLGESKRVDTFGQTRLAVVFHRLLMPDGYAVGLDQFKGLNQIGDTGLRDQVNNHYLRIFGVSLAIGALGAVAEGGTAGALNANSSDLMRQGFAQSTAQSSAQILDKFLNIPPTVTIREGHRVKVYLSSDLALPDYANHKMPSDL